MPYPIAMRRRVVANERVDVEKELFFRGVDLDDAAARGSSSLPLRWFDDGGTYEHRTPGEWMALAAPDQRAYAALGLDLATSRSAHTARPTPRPSSSDQHTALGLIC